MFVPCSLVATCWERADFLALSYLMFSCVLVTYPCDVLGLVWYLFVLVLIFAFFLTFLVQHK